MFRFLYALSSRVVLNLATVQVSQSLRLKLFGNEFGSEKVENTTKFTVRIQVKFVWNSFRIVPRMRKIESSEHDNCIQQTDNEKVLQRFASLYCDELLIQSAQTESSITQITKVLLAKVSQMIHESKIEINHRHR